MPGAPPQAHKSAGLLAGPCGQFAAGFGYRHVRPVSGEMDLPQGKEATMIDAMAAAQRRLDAGEADGRPIEHVSVQEI